MLRNIAQHCSTIEPVSNAYLLSMRRQIDKLEIDVYLLGDLLIDSYETINISNDISIYIREF